MKKIPNAIVTITITLLIFIAPEAKLWASMMMAQLTCTDAVETKEYKFQNSLNEKCNKKTDSRRF